MINPTDNASKTLQWLAAYLNVNNINFVSKKMIELADNLSKISAPNTETENPSTEYTEKDKYEKYYKNEYSGASSQLHVCSCGVPGCVGDPKSTEPLPDNPLVASSTSDTTKLVDHAWAGIAKQTEMSMNMQRLIIHQLAQINTSLSMAIVKLANPPESDKNP